MKLFELSRLFVGVMGCLALVACNSMKHGAEKAVRQNLKDPDSAKFGEFYYNKKTGKGCLTVNSKNSMGGYTGNQQAYVKNGKDGWTVIGIGDIDQQGCRSVFADQA